MSFRRICNKQDWSCDPYIQHISCDIWQLISLFGNLITTRNRSNLILFLSLFFLFPNFYLPILSNFYLKNRYFPSILLSFQKLGVWDTEDYLISLRGCKIALEKPKDFQVRRVSHQESANIWIKDLWHQIPCAPLRITIYSFKDIWTNMNTSNKDIWGLRLRSVISLLIACGCSDYSDSYYIKYLEVGNIRNNGF